MRESEGKTCWSMLVIPESKRQQQEDDEFDAIPGLREISYSQNSNEEGGVEMRMWVSETGITSVRPWA